VGRDHLQTGAGVKNEQMSGLLSLAQVLQLLIASCICGSIQAICKAHGVLVQHLVKWSLE